MILQASDEEVAKYVSHKIQMAGGSLSILSEAALSAVHGYAQGNARMIDNLMTDALIIGEQTEKQVIDPKPFWQRSITSSFEAAHTAIYALNTCF